MENRFIVSGGWLASHLDDPEVVPVDVRSPHFYLAVTPDKTIIAYCRSGGRASHTFLGLKALGYPDVRNYLAGWQEWGNRDDTPVDEG